MKRPLRFNKALTSSLKTTLLCSSLVAITTCYGSNDLLEDTAHEVAHPIALRLDINTCAKELGILIEELQKQKEVGIYVTLRKDRVPKDLQGVIKVSKKGALCTDIRALHVVKQTQLDEQATTKINLEDNKIQATRAEKRLLRNMTNLTNEEETFLINGIYADLGFANKGHFFRIFNNNTRAIKSLTAQNDYLLNLLKGAAELTHVPHGEIFEHLYRYPTDILNVRNQDSLAIIKEALECFFPE